MRSGRERWFVMAKRKLSDYRMPEEAKKTIAVYGMGPDYQPVYQRYWKRRKDGIKQRYRKKTKRLKKVVKSKRWEIEGTGKKLYRATVLAHRLIPREDFTTVSAEKLLENPEKYGYEGEWLEVEVDYRG